MPTKTGDTVEIVELITFNRKINKGRNRNLLEFRIDPNLMSYQDELIFSHQRNHTKTEICLADIDKYNAN